MHKLDIGRKYSGWGDLSEWEAFGGREVCFMSREREVRNEFDFALNPYMEIATRWIEVSIEIYWALNLDIGESVKVLLRIYW